MILITRRDEFLESEILEIVREIMKEIAYTRIVAVAQNDLSLEMIFVMPQLALDVLKLRVELVLF